MNVEALARKHGIPVRAVRKRLQRGTPLDAPYKPRNCRPRTPTAEHGPDPLNAAYAAWRPVCLLGVRHNLRWRI